MSGTTNRALSGGGVAAASTGPEFDCDSGEVGRILEQMARLTCDHGATFAPGFVVRERAGMLSGHREQLPLASSDDNPLICVPEVALPRVADGTWSIEGDEVGVVVEREAPALTAQLLRLFAQLFSATGKAAWYHSEHPRGALEADSPTVAAICSLRPEFHVDPTAEGFLKTRTYGVGQDREPALMPIADSLNHHRGGAQLGFADGALQILERHPTGTSECFVTYGVARRGTLDFALQYGFVDQPGPAARSAPIVVEVPEVGTVTVGMRAGQMRSKLDPPTISGGPGDWDFSHLTFVPQKPEQLLVPIGMVLRSSGVAHSDEVTRDLLTAVAQANIALLDNLRNTADADTPVGQVLVDACAIETAMFGAWLEAVR